MPKKKTHSEFISQMQEVNPRIEITGHYQNANTPIECNCLGCGHEWKARPYSLLQHKGCARCAGNLKKTHQQFLNDLVQLTSTVSVLEKYAGDGKKIKCKCAVCGYVWEIKPNDLLNGHNCPKCAKVALKTHEEYISDASRIQPDIEILGTYKKSSSKILCRCKKCNYEWEPVANSLLTGRSCPECSKSSTSFIEQFIFLSFGKALGTTAVRHRDRRAIGKELDIYIPSLSVAIEPGAWYWHKNKLNNDQAKRDLCSRKGIRLFFVYDNCGEVKLPPFEHDCYIYQHDLAYEKGNESLRRLITELFLQLDIECSFSENDWAKLAVLAKQKSQKMSQADFIAVLAKKNPNIEVLDAYAGSSTPIQCRCKKCGKEWLVRPSDLLNKDRGCPKCGHARGGKKLSRTRRKTNAQFLSELKLVNPRIIPLEEYKTGHEPIICRCDTCGHEWKARPSNLLHGTRCPVCEKASRRLDNKEIVARLRQCDAQLSIVDDYEGMNKAMQFKCKSCGHTFIARPNNVLHQGQRCPTCRPPEKTK